MRCEQFYIAVSTKKFDVKISMKGVISDLCDEYARNPRGKRKGEFTER